MLKIKNSGLDQYGGEPFEQHQFGSADAEDDHDEVAYFTVRWKTRELVLSTAPKTWDNTDKDSKTENGPISRGSQSEVSMLRDLCGKRFTKKVSFEFRVKEWSGDGWGKWRREGWIEWVSECVGFNVPLDT